MELLTFLGTGNYQTTCYTWQNQSKETPYVADALVDFFSPQAVKAFVTPEAKAKHGETFSQSLNCDLTLIEIPSGKSEAEIWEIFEAVVNAVEANSEISFDITHAFRSLPLLVLLAGAFLQKARNVTIKGVYYGAFEVDREQPPIFELTPAMKLLDWLTATDKFLTTGSAVELGELLATVQSDFYRQSKPKKGDFRPQQLRKFGDSILKLSQSLEYVRVMDSLNASAELEGLSTERLTEEVGVFAKPFELLLTPIQEAYGQFAVTDSRNADLKLVLEKQFLLLRWYVSKQLGTQAILLAREWIVSAFCYWENLNYLETTERKIIEDQLGRTIGKEGTFNEPIIRHVSDPQLLSNTWSKLVEYRNDIAHCQKRKTSISAERLGKYVNQKLLEELATLFPDFAI